MSNQPKTRDIYVTDISFDATEEDLKKLFTVCGTVKHIRLLTDPRSGKFAGRAFVSMGNAEQAREAINMLDGTRLVNRCITVKAARATSPMPQEAASPVKNRRTAPRQRPKKTRS